MARFAPPPGLSPPREFDICIPSMGRMQPFFAIGQHVTQCPPRDVAPARHNGTGPAETAHRTPIKDPGVLPLPGPCFCKLLVPNYIVGRAFGQRWALLGEMESALGCKVLVSPVKSRFPGTSDRMLILSGTLKSLGEGLDQVLVWFAEQRGKLDEEHLLVKLVVPNSFVSLLIGRQGKGIEGLMACTGCRVNVSKRLKELRERIVLISGTRSASTLATKLIVDLLQKDPNLPEHLHFSYDVTLPLGIWEGKPALNPELALMSPEEAQQCSKKVLIEYLRKAAPRELLLKHSLLGEIRNVKKVHNTTTLVAAVRDLWERTQQSTFEEAPPYTDVSSTASAASSTAQNTSLTSTQDNVLSDTSATTSLKHSRRDCCSTADSECASGISDMRCMMAMPYQ